MRQRLAGDLAKQHIPAIQHSQDQSGANLLATEIRKRERHGHRIARYKSFHASSSSAEVQSGPHAVWAKGSTESSLSGPADCRLFKNFKKFQTSRRISSGALSISESKA